MSSLRLESLRLCWLEAFIAVVDKENISDAARSLDIDQSTVSRYMQALQNWLGKKLIEPGTVEDPEDVRLSVGATKDGLAFYEVAKSSLKALTDFRQDHAIRREILNGMDQMVCSMEKDRQRKVKLPITAEVNEKINTFRSLISNIPDEIPLSDLIVIRGFMRIFFNEYERRRNKDKRRNNKNPAP